MNLANNRICWKCVEESFVSNLIKKSGKSAICHYCSQKRRTCPLPHIGDLVQRAVSDHYERTCEYPEGYDYYLQRMGQWERPGEPIKDVISWILGVNEEAAADLQELLDDRTMDWDSVKAGEEQPYSSAAQYERVSIVQPAKLGEEYRRFEKSVIEEARYFSPTSRALLSSLFGALEGMVSNDGQPVIAMAGPGRTQRSFYRARVFQDSAQLSAALMSPEMELGPPPKRRGRAGRLNAAGVSVFYGADTVETAIAEVRPPVGSRVLSASFTLLRSVRLLDIELLKSVLVAGSLFDIKYKSQLEHAAFLESFGSRFSQAVMPDHEAFEYVPTQAVADFIANEISPAIDGILYQSPQTGGRNVALFSRVSHVEQRTVVDGTETSVWFGQDTEDGYEVDYTVYESVPDPEDETCVKRVMAAPSSYARSEGETPQVTLRLDLDTLTVHEIQRIEIRSASFPVTLITQSKSSTLTDC